MDQLFVCTEEESLWSLYSDDEQDSEELFGSKLLLLLQYITITVIIISLYFLDYYHLDSDFVMFCFLFPINYER